MCLQCAQYFYRLSTDSKNNFVFSTSIPLCRIHNDMFLSIPRSTRSPSVHSSSIPAHRNPYVHFSYQFHTKSTNRYVLCRFRVLLLLTAHFHPFPARRRCNDYNLLHTNLQNRNRFFSPALPYGRSSVRRVSLHLRFSTASFLFGRSIHAGQVRPITFYFQVLADTGTAVHILYFHEFLNDIS